MPMSKDPTHPKTADNVDDVAGHGFRRSAVPDEDVEGHARRSPIDAPPEEGAAEAVSRPDADDVEAHGRNTPPDAEAVSQPEDAKRSPVDGTEDDVAGHMPRLSGRLDVEGRGKRSIGLDAQPASDEYIKVVGPQERADDEDHDTKGRAVRSGR